MPILYQKLDEIIKELYKVLILLYYVFTQIKCFKTVFLKNFFIFLFSVIIIPGDFMENEIFMNEALKLAELSLKNKDVPVGAVVVKDGKVIGCGYNRKEFLQDSTEHAEIMAIKEACKYMKSYHLEGCDLYVTFEPCPMCAGAIINARIENVYIGAMNYRFGACGSYINLLNMDFNHKCNVKTGILQDQCSQLISEFFAMLRKEKKQTV